MAASDFLRMGGSVNMALKKSSEEQYRVRLYLKYKTRQIPLGQEEIWKVLSLLLNLYISDQSYNSFLLQVE